MLAAAFTNGWKTEQVDFTDCWPSEQLISPLQFKRRRQINKWLESRFLLREREFYLSDSITRGQFFTWNKWIQRNIFMCNICCIISLCLNSEERVSQSLYSVSSQSKSLNLMFYQGSLVTLSTGPHVRQAYCQYVVFFNQFNQKYNTLQTQTGCAYN